MLMEQFSFRIMLADPRVAPKDFKVVVSHRTDGRSKEFLLAGVQSLDALANAMCNITDVQCEDYFPKAHKPKPKKDKTVASV